LLAHNFSKRASFIRRPSQDELLGLLSVQLQLVLQSGGTIPLQFQEDSYSSIKVLLAVGCLPPIQDRAQFALRVPNRDSCPWPANLQTLERTEALGNLWLDALPRTTRIFYPARRDIRPELQVAANRGTSA
jgi:hypothetical protein